MKKFLITMLCLGVVALTASNVMAFAGTYLPGSGINGTVHDMSTGAYAAQPADPIGGRICIFCHAPHNTIKLSTANGGTALGSNVQASDAFTYLPLWNHQLTAIDPSAYLMYWNGPGAPQSGSHASQAIQLGMLPGSVSLLCLSCHDGSVAVNSYGTGPNGGLVNVQPAGSSSGGGITMNSAYIIGQDAVLQNHHPIGFDYNLVQAADTEIRPSSTVLSNYSGNTMTIQDHLYGASIVSGCTTGNCLECGSCHSVHNKSNTGERLLWRTDKNSAFCLTCHDKGTYTAPETAPVGPLP